MQTPETATQQLRNAQVAAQIDADYNALKVKWESFMLRGRAAFARVNSISGNVFLSLEDAAKNRPKSLFLEVANGAHVYTSAAAWELLRSWMSFVRSADGAALRNLRLAYGDQITAGQLVKRLFVKKPVVCDATSTRYVLRSDAGPFAVQTQRTDAWHNVQDRLLSGDPALPHLQEYVCYDELMLASLFGASAWTFFVADGTCDDPDDFPENAFVESGCLCAISAVRLDKAGYFEHRFAFAKNDAIRTFSTLQVSDAFWTARFPNAFPQAKIPTAAEIAAAPTVYGEIYTIAAARAPSNQINLVYLAERLRLTFVPFLKEANFQGSKEGSRVIASLCYFVTECTGADAIHNTFIKEFLIKTILQYVDENFDCENIGFIAALYVPHVSLDVYEDFEPKKHISILNIDPFENFIVVKFKNHPSYTLTLVNNDRAVATALPEAFENLLLVSSFVTLGNSYPANGYFVADFSTEEAKVGLCSTVGQFMNPEVNVGLCDEDKIKKY